MKHKVDYFSFTYFSQAVADAPNQHLWATFRKELPPFIRVPDTWEHAPKRPGMDGGMVGEGGVYCWYNHTGLILVEHTGEGCDKLEQRGELEYVIETYAHRASRLDVATDIYTPVKPSEFVEYRLTNRSKAEGFQTSKSGETCYIGSRKSDRTCKVYRYFEPHPRHEWLRIEYTYRKEQAREACFYLVKHGVEELCVKSSERYKWSHDAWKTPDKAIERLKSWRPERGQGRTVAWVYSQCIPAIAKLVRMGLVNLEDIINEIEKQAQA